MIENSATTPFNPCAIIPVYNHPHRLTALTREIAACQLPIIFMDDGSTNDCHQVIKSLCQQHDNFVLVTHESNQGKGAAVKTGLYTALTKGYTHALQIDADGQHSVKDIPTFIQAAKASPHSLIAGYPAYDNSIPKFRYYARYLSHVWVWINTLSTVIKDSMCGFRVYPVAASCQLLDDEAMGNRMDFDGEFIVRWFWRYRSLQQLATQVTYPENNTSNFLLFTDNKLISLMHTRLFFGMLKRLPKLLFSKNVLSAKWNRS